jgi:hypothetical protein
LLVAIPNHLAPSRRYPLRRPYVGDRDGVFARLGALEVASVVEVFSDLRVSDILGRRHQVTVASVRDLIARYVAGSISAADLSNALPDGGQLDDADETTADLVLRTMGYLAECENGDRPEHELRKALEPEASWRLRESRSGVESITRGQPELSIRAGTGKRLRAVPVS